MGISIRLTNLGIEITEDNGHKTPLQPAKDACQEKPRKNYVYAHLDEQGNIFYVGMGVDRRAWNKDRHPLWQRYVQKHLGGKYHVQILQDNLSPEEAEELESEWIAQCGGDTLVNWVNMGRSCDFEANERLHTLRDANRVLIQQAKLTEKRDLEEAVTMYLRAIDAIPRYAFIQPEKGLVGKLLDEFAAECGYHGELESMDRLSMCLVKLGRAAEAKQHAERYFEAYRLDLDYGAAERINKRIEKALSRKK